MRVIHSKWVNLSEFSGNSLKFFQDVTEISWSFFKISTDFETSMRSKNIFLNAYFQQFFAFFFVIFFFLQFFGIFPITCQIFSNYFRTFRISQKIQKIKSEEILEERNTFSRRILRVLCPFCNWQQIWNRLFANFFVWEYFFEFFKKFPEIFSEYLRSFLKFCQNLYRFWNIDEKRFYRSTY